LTWPSYGKTVPATWGVQHDCPRLWLVSGRGWSVQRFDANNALAPLAASRVADGTSRPMAKLAIQVAGMAVGKQPIVIDADQTIELYAQSLSVAALVPVTVDEVRSTSSLEVPAGQIAVDDLLGVAIEGIQAPIGAKTATLTQYVVAPANTVTSVPVPRAAKSVLVSPADLAAPGAWTWHVGDPAVLASSLTVGSFAPSDESLRVPAATHLSVAADPAVRIFAITWTIAP